MKKSVKLVLWIVAAALAIGGGAAYSMAPLKVETAVMRPVDAKITFTEQGVYLYDKSVSVMPQISGEVLEVKVDNGDTVKKGDTLAVISASDYEHQIGQLESTVSGFQAQISNLHTQEQENKVTLTQSRESLAGQIRELNAAIKDFDKTQKSLDTQIKMQEDIITDHSNIVFVLRQEYRQAQEDYDDDFIELSQLNAARTAYFQGQAMLDASMQQLEQMKNGGASKAGLEAQRDSLISQLELVDGRLKRDNTLAMQQYYNAMIEGTKKNIESMGEKLGQANITAPTDGVITGLPVKDANLVTAVSSVATISSEPAVEVFVPLRDIDSVHIGGEVELIIDKRLGDESFTGKVVKIEDEATVKISALGVEERKIRVLIEPQGNRLNIGYGVDVKFTVLEEKNSIVAPKTAVFEQDGKDFVWLVESGALQLREVVKGVETREGFVITSGLGEGDEIIPDAGVDGLNAGKKVKAAE